MSKGQFAVEHLLVIGIGIMIMIPVINMFYTYSTEQTNEMKVDQIIKIAHHIIDSSESVYYMGAPSKRTLEEQFPSGIRDIEIIDNEFLVFYFGPDNSSIPFLSDVEIDGPFFEQVGEECNEACYSQGKKNIVIYAGERNSSIVIK